MTTDPLRPPSRLDDLIALAQERSSENRDTLLVSMTGLFLTEPTRHTPIVHQHFDVIMSRIAKDAAPQIRRDVAAQLAPVKMAPRRLINQLARDHIGIAEPILRQSPALREEDLAQLIREASPEHLAAIAQRPTLSGALADELVQYGDEAVLVCLAGNQQAQISTGAMELLVDHARSLNALQKPMTERLDLSPLLLTALYFFVPPELKSEILKRADFLDPALVGEAIKTNRQKILAMARTRAAHERPNMPAHAYREITGKIQANAVNERYLNILLDSRQFKPFVLAFSYNIGADPATAHMILKDKSWNALAIAARSAGFERNSFAKIIGALDKNRTRDPKTHRLFHLYTNIPENAAERIMRFWRVRRHNAEDEGTARRPKIHDLPKKAHR